MYVPMRVVRWDNLEFEVSLFPFSAKGPKECFDGCEGFMPVFNTLEDLRKEYPYVEYFQIHTAGKDGG